MQAIVAPTAVIQARTALAMNSGPLSERTWPGTPRRMNRSESRSTTSTEFSFRPTRIARAGLAGELVDDVEHAVLPSIVAALLAEVVGPDMDGSGAPAAAAGTSHGPARA